MHQRLATAGLLAIGLALVGPGTASAVTYLEQIDRLEAVYAALLDYRPGAVPGPRPAGRIEVGAELDPIPHIDNKVGAKSEPVSSPPAVARARADWSPIRGVRLGGFAIPPVTVQGTTANLYGVEAEVGWAFGSFPGSLRVFALQGTVTGPITEPAASDTFALDGTGADVRLGWTLDAWTLYGGLGHGNNHTRLRVDSDGAVIDRRRAYGYGFLGAGWTQGPWTFVAEQHQTESYLDHIVLTVTYGF